MHYGGRAWEESRVYRMAKGVNAGVDAGVDAGVYAGESAGSEVQRRSDTRRVAGSAKDRVRELEKHIGGTSDNIMIGQLKCPA